MPLTTFGRSDATAVHRARHAEIRELGHADFVEQDVRRRHVSMQDGRRLARGVAPTVRRVEGAQDLDADGGDELPRGLLPADAVSLDPAAEVRSPSTNSVTRK